MPLTKKEVSTPPKTDKTNPLVTIVDVPAPWIVNVEAMFPRGGKRAIGFRLKDRNIQFAPTGNDWITDEDNTVAWPEEKLLIGPPYSVEIETFNMAADYPHSIEFRLTSMKNLPGG